jgi:NAD(P)-dependent dehydrogenase (short-subunit alcohol dehydrogenase family)
MGSLTVTLARSKSVVITGASSGLAKAAALHLSELGYRVFAGVRTESSAAELSGVSPPNGVPCQRVKAHSRHELVSIVRSHEEGAKAVAI